MRETLLVIALTLIVAPLALGQVDKAPAKDKMAAHATPEMGYYRAALIAWSNGPASLPAGAKLAVIEGDPTKAGLFTMRFMFPDGYTIPPHFHSQVEHVTVLSGRAFLGMGEKFDKTAGRELNLGDFAFMPIGMRHYFWTEGETIIQLHGQGPWTITYVNPQDDPRAKK